VTALAGKLLTELEAKANGKEPLVADDPQVAYAVSLAATGLATPAATGVDASARAARLHAAAMKLTVYPVGAKARVLAILAGKDPYAAVRSALVKDLTSRVHETAAAATVTAHYAEGERLLLVSANRTTALALDAFIRETPASPLIVKLARGLLDGRRGG